MAKKATTAKHSQCSQLPRFTPDILFLPRPMHWVRHSTALYRRCLPNTAVYFNYESHEPWSNTAGRGRLPHDSSNHGLLDTHVSMIIFTRSDSSILF